MKQVLNYNVFLISRLIKSGKVSHLTPYLDNDYKKVFDKYDKLGLNKNPVYDRSGKVPHYLDMSSVHPMPYVDSFNKSFYEVCDERCKELAALNKPIKVYWSGGIDSTFVLFYLSQFVPKDQITVYGTYASVIESGDVFDKFIKNNYKREINIYPTQDIRYKVEDCIWVTGFQGNQLFGPTDDFFSSDRSISFFHHTLGTKETIYKDYKTNIDAEIVEFLEPSIQASPRKIETVADLRWYCIFNYDWYNGIYELTSEMNPDKVKTIHHFFDTEDFQKWAIHTKEPWTKVAGQPNTHRWQMRDFIADCGPKDYARNKTKAISNVVSNNGHWMLTLDDYENIYDR